MKYTVLTIITRSHTPPKPKESFAVGVREEGCLACIVTSKGTLDACGSHYNLRIMDWVELELADDTENIPKDEGLLPVGPATGAEEPVEVSEGSVELPSV